MGHRYEIGDRVLVTSGYDGDDSLWLAGGDGYLGVITAMTADMATVALDHELVLEAGGNIRWQDFGAGSAHGVRETSTARGMWLVLIHGWVGQTWTDPIRLHVGLCEQEPVLEAIPKGGGIGYWVESHASIMLEPPSHEAGIGARTTNPT
jgi:hypothetical protein